MMVVESDLLFGQILTASVCLMKMFKTYSGYVTRVMMSVA